MPFWSKPYLVRRSTNILSYAVRQNWDLLQTGGEACFLLKRMARANASFQLEDRRVDYIEDTINLYLTDPDIGFLRYKLWGEDTHRSNQYPDLRTFTVTVQASGSTDPWEVAIDKYSFISNRMEYAFDVYQDELNSNGIEVEDAVYIVFNTPPFTANDIVRLTHGIANPFTDWHGDQPMRDNQEEFKRSMFGFEQWLKPDAFVRSRRKPNRFLLAFPGILTDFTITEAGLLRESQNDFWTVPSPYSPQIVEGDVIVRESTTQRFQVTNFTPIYIEDILVSQHFNLVELDPRSSLYGITIATS